VKSASAKELLVRDSGPFGAARSREQVNETLFHWLVPPAPGAVESAGADIALIAIDHEGDTSSSGADLIEIAPFPYAGRPTQAPLQHFRRFGICSGRSKNAARR
jgi:hypothetical protein